MAIHFFTVGESYEFWWKDAKFIPRVGELVKHEFHSTYNKVIEVRHENEELAIITLA